METAYDYREKSSVKDYIGSIKELLPIFLFSCGVAFIFGRQRIKASYKGRTLGCRLISDLLTAVCTGFLAVCASVVTGLILPDALDETMQICLCGLLSGYGMNVINRLVMKALRLDAVDVEDSLDILEAQSHRKNHAKREKSNKGTDA